MPTAVAAPPRGPKPLTDDRKSQLEQMLLYVIVIVPFLALGGAIAVAWGWGISWLDVGLALAFYLLSGLGVTVGFHRYFTHGGFKAKRWLRVLLAVAGSLAIEGGVIRWVADHRRHHAFSDKEGDPHSPWRYGNTVPALLKGLWFAHIGWLFDVEHTNQQRFTPDLLADPDIVRVERWFNRLIVVSLLAPAVLGGLITWSWTGALSAFFWAQPGPDRPAAPRDLVDQLDLPRDRRAPVRRPGQVGELLAAGDPVLRRVVAQLAPRRPEHGPARGAARADRHLRAGHRRPRAPRLGVGRQVADA